MNNNLDKEYNFFDQNRSDLIKKYKGKFLVIIGEKIAGIYNSEAEAYSVTTKNNKPGTFLIQQCLPDKELPVQTFHSRVVFSV